MEGMPSMGCWKASIADAGPRSGLSSKRNTRYSHGAKTIWCTGSENTTLERGHHQRLQFGRLASEAVWLVSCARKIG